jgi:iron complex outermembrane receptor protein
MSQHQKPNDAAPPDWNRMAATGLIVAVALSLPCAAAAGAAPSALADQTRIEEVLVFGRGEVRQVQSLTASQLQQFPAGTSPLKAIEKLPGVNFQSADPFGAYEWSTRIVVRGFNQNQLGFTLDGVPLGDMSYANHNGLHISRAILSENIGRVALSQGTGALGTASTSNLGGTLQFYSADPEREFGVLVNGTAGSDSNQRIFLRVDTGTLGTGTEAYLAYATQEADLWKGNGVQEQAYINLKVVQPIGAARLSGYYSYSDRNENDYQDMSSEMVRRLGRNWGNYFPDYARAIAAAQGNFSGRVNSLDDAYWNAAGLREDHLGYLSLELPLGETMMWTTTAYLHTNEGQGLWGTPYVATPGGAPLSVRTTEYDIDRRGLVTALNFELGAHTINAGIWYEDNEFNQARRFYGEPFLDRPTRSFTKFQSNPFFTQWEYEFTTETVQFHVQDTWQVSDDLRLEFGFKSVIVDVEADTRVGANKTGKIKTDETFLPQIGFVYTLNDQHEFFGDIARNVRALIGSATGTSPFASSQAAFDEIRGSIKPEMSTTWELGWRFLGDRLEGVVTAYYVDFEDRLLAIPQGSQIIGNFSALANVGSVETVGVEAGLNWQANDWLSWFNSVSYNRSTYEDDYTAQTANGPVVIPTSGNTVPDAPEWLFNSEVGVETDTLFAKLHFKYTGKRYYTYLNQGSVSSFSLLNMTLGYRFPPFGFLKDLTAQLDVTNLYDENYIGTVGSGGFGNTDPDGTAQTLLPGAPRQVFFSLKAAF